MDYEKKYNEALKWMRELYPRFPGAFKEEIEHYFPELRESEDERNDRMRGRVIESLVCYRGKVYDEGDKEVALLVDEEIAWMKKQKEQKPELVQQPPITYTYNSNASKDERLKAALLALLNSDLLKVKEGGYFTKQDLIEWVERIPTDKPAAWSEKDEEMRLEAIRVLVSGCERYRKESGCLPGWHKVIAWLKSLRPGWKPTEEQIYSLGTVVNGIEHVAVGSVGYNLKELYEQLKKL